MRYKIVNQAAMNRWREEAKVTTPSPFRRPPPARPVRLAPPPPTPIRPGMFAPMSWPGTSRDVEWSSAPQFGRTLSGWGGQGFTR